MDVLICQTCGFILRGQGKFCTGCGAPVTRFSPTTVPMYGTSTAGAAIPMVADPLVLERVLVQKSLQQPNGNGGNGEIASSPQVSTPLVNFALSAESTENETAGIVASPPQFLATNEPQLASPPPLDPPQVVAESPDFLPPAAPPAAEWAQAALAAGPNIQESAPFAMADNHAAGFDLLGGQTSPASEVNSSSTDSTAAALNPSADANDVSAAVSESPATSPQVTAAAPPASFDFFASEAGNWQNSPTSGSFSTESTTPAGRDMHNAQPDNFFAGAVGGDTFSRYDEPAPTSFAEPPLKLGSETAIAPSLPAANIQQAAAPPDSASTPAEPTPPVENTDSKTASAVAEHGYPDESYKRRSSKTSDSSGSATEEEASTEKSKDPDNKPVTVVNQVLKHLEGDIDIAGRAIPKKLAAIAAIFLVFFGMQILGAIGKIFSGGGAASSGKMQVIAGTWDMAYKYSGKVVQAEMDIYQDGSSVTGEGQDGKYFQIRGTYKPPDIEFNKIYVDAVTGKILSKEPVLYTGKVKTDYTDRYPTMTGVYATKIKKGYYYDARYEQVKDLWDASMRAPAKANGAAGTGTAGASPDELARKDPKEFHNKLMMIAIGILCVMGGLAFASLKMFGPSGMVNIWSKREYIPSQFKSQHNKMLGELGRPAKPGGVPLGKRDDWNVLQLDKPRELALTPEQREANPHMLVLGAGAKGKSRFIAHLVAHDIQCNERAVVVIDSDGTLIDLIIRWMAAHPKGSKFAKRTVIIDPTHKGGCPAYNPLELPDDSDLQAAASAVVFGFKAIYTEPPGSQSQWNQQTANILRNSALLLMANGKTLVDLPTLLSDNDFRDILLDKIEKRKDERVEFITLLETWGQYKRLARTDQWITWVEPILNRVSPMLSDPRIRPILTKTQGDLNLKNLITENKILLVKIPQGQLDQNANLLGSLLVTGLKQSALSIATGTGRRHPCALYLDEFDNFIEKETVDSLTSETKKFQIGMVAAIKTLQHLPEDFRNQLIINVGTLCAFALAKKDGDMLGPQMFRVDGRKIKHQTLSNLFNRVNTSPQFELISDEEKLNIDRVVGQEEKTYFCYRVGTIAGVFHMKSHDFDDIPDKDINWSLIDEMYAAHVKVDV